MADEFIKAYFEKYAGIRDFVDRTADGAKESGKVTTLKGRIRSIPGISSRNRTEQMAAARIAVNTPIQGSAADIVKVAMLNLVARLNRSQLKSKLILQVHDELVFEVPEIEIDEMRKLVREEMENAVKLDIPLRVSIETGASWGELH
jgi:DNA polymerase-1